MRMQETVAVESVLPLTRMRGRFGLLFVNNVAQTLPGGQYARIDGEVAYLAGLFCRNHAPWQT